MSGFSTARQKMVDGQVRTCDVTDARIIDAMLAVPREVFVPAKQRSLAYLDLDLDVSDGGPWSDNAQSRLVMLGPKPMLGALQSQ